jgi:hypothetical protein
MIMCDLDLDVAAPTCDEVRPGPVDDSRKMSRRRVLTAAGVSAALTAGGLIGRAQAAQAAQAAPLSQAARPHPGSR